MTGIIHDLGPLGATTATTVHTIPAAADTYVDDENGDYGYPIIVLRNQAGDVTHVVELGEGDPMDQHQVAMAMASAWQRVAERMAEIETRAGGDR